jgi:hypothetical protein
MSAKRQILVKNKRYKGNYVAFKSFNDRKVVASGKNPSDVLNKSRKKGAKTPVLVFVNKDDTAYIY